MNDVLIFRFRKNTEINSMTQRMKHEDDGPLAFRLRRDIERKNESMATNQPLDLPIVKRHSYWFRILNSSLYSTYRKLDAT